MKKWKRYKLILSLRKKTIFEGNFEMNCYPHPLFILNKPYQ